jgi:hypothetical protein
VLVVLEVLVMGQTVLMVQLQYSVQLQAQAVVKVKVVLVPQAVVQVVQAAAEEIQDIQVVQATLHQ